MPVVITTRARPLREILPPIGETMSVGFEIERAPRCALGRSSRNTASMPFAAVTPKKQCGEQRSEGTCKRRKIQHERACHQHAFSAEHVAERPKKSRTERDTARDDRDAGGDGAMACRSALEDSVGLEECAAERPRLLRAFRMITWPPIAEKTMAGLRKDNLLVNFVCGG